MNEEDAVPLDDKDRHGEVNFFVYMRHRTLTLARAGRGVKLLRGAAGEAGYLRRR
jgi:hypothetical protein